MMRRLIGGLLGLSIALAATQAQAISRIDPEIDARIESARKELLSSPADAMRHAQSLRDDVEHHAQGRTRVLGLAAADWIRGAVLLSQDKPKEAIPVIQGALRSLEREAPDVALHGELLLARGSALQVLGQIADALRDYQAAYDVFGKAADPRGQAAALQHIAAAYSSAGDYENALRYGGDSVTTYSGDPMLLLTAFNNRGNALIQLGRFKAAEAEYAKALDEAGKIGSPVLQTRVLQNLARSQADSGELAPADATLARAFTIAASGPASSWRPALYGVSALVALRRHDLDRAADLINRTFASAGDVQASMPMRDFHRTAYEIFRARGEDAKALEHLEAFKRLDDEQRALTASAGAALAGARFDFARQDLQISELRGREAQAQAAAANARVRFFVMLLAGTALVLVLLLIGFFSIRRSRNQVRAANASLSVTNADLAKALAAKTEFLATTSHEIRTPLNGILGMTQVILADKAVGPALRSRIELVHGAGETMRALVDDILDVAKMETGELRIHPAEMNLTRLLRDAATVWTGQAETKKIGITLDIDEAPAAIVADEVRLRQIVFNLMSNAIKFTDRGQVRLTAKAIEHDQGEHLLIEVQDSGIGIPPDRLEEIFESFRQVDGGTTRRHGGTGLGLTICRSLARAMGGDIDVASTLGAGSAFTIDIPLVRAVLPVVEMADERSDIDSLARAELLLVEANPLSQGILRALLSPKVRQLHIVAEPAEALRAIATGSIDHILADGGALGLDLGVVAQLAEAAGVQRARLSILWPTPDADVVAAINSAGAHLISKPITAPELLNALEMIYRPQAASHGIAA
jgi:signal transduction histidine kinase